MFLSAKIKDGPTAEFELNFTNNTWSLAPAQAKWANVMFSDRGLFEIKTWGVIWLMDGLGTKKDSAIILHDAPTGEKDEKHSAGTGAAYAPALAKYKDAEIHWQALRKSIPTELAASRTSGPLTAVRVKAKQICEGLLPKAELTSGTRPATGTACGEFPGRVLRRMPVKGGGQPGAFSLQVTGSGLLYLTSPTTHWENFGKAIDEKYKPAKKCWADFGAKLPKTGDIYVLSNFENQGAFQHVGMIISSEGRDWVTADGGQGNGGQSGFISRKFHPSGQIDGEFGAKAWLKGWIDLHNLR